MSPNATAMPASPRRTGRWIALLAIVLAFGFLGLRGIWDPDEGRYTNVAMHMLDRGDWVYPHRSDEVGHWTKPPLTYWAIAASAATFGRNPWAARLPAALAFLLCTWLVWRIGRRLAAGSEDVAALAYATMLLPFGASQLITTDFLLAGWEALAMWAFVEARWGDPAQSRRWGLLLWAAFALAFLTKGPPGLLPLAAMLAFDLLQPRGQRGRLFGFAGPALFLLLAAPWFVVVMLGTPGLFHYMVGDEVVNRIATNEFRRFGTWYGWLQVYVPTLLLGTLPWTPALLRWARRLPADVRGWWRAPQRRREQREWLLPTLWLLLPLLVFCLSRSRLPLYLLPLFPALALLVAMQRRREGRGLPDRRAIAGWALLLLGLDLAASQWHTHKDAGEWAKAIRERVQGPVTEVCFVADMARYGLHLELGTEVEKLSIDPEPGESRIAPENDSDVAGELAEHETGLVWITKQEKWPQVQARIAELGYRPVVQGTPYYGRVIFRVLPAAGG